MAHYFRSTGANWGTIGDWSSTPSPIYTAVAAVPTAADDVIFEPASNNCIVNTSNRVCKSINFTGYGNVLNMTFSITVSGNVTFIATQSSRISGAGALIVNAASTITSNGGTWPNGLTFTGPITVTLSDALTVSGTFTTQTNTVTINTSSINIQGSFTIGANLAGTSTMNINGTGNQTWNVSSGSINIDTDINKPSGNLILAAGGRNFGSTTTGKTLTYTTLGTGTFITTGSNLILYNCSVRSNGANWGTVTGSSNSLTTTITLLDNMACDTLISGGSFGTNFNSFNLNIYGNISISSQGIFGTAIFNIVGTVNQTWAGGQLGANLKINKPSGSFIMTATCSYGSAINPLFEHVDGPVVTTGSIFKIASNCQVKSNVSDPDAVIFNDLGFGNQPYTLTLIDNMTINSFTPDGGGTGGGQINGNTLFVKGNIVLNAMGTSFFFGGTTIFNISGTGNQIWNNISTSTLRNSVVIDKPSGTLSLTGASYVAWGIAGNTLTYIQGTINPGTSIFISATGSIFNLTNTGFLLFNWNPSSGTQTINNNPLIINGSTLIQGTIIFAGNRGFTTQNLTCTVPAAVITLQNIVANPSAEYIVNGVLTLTGTAANRITLQAAGSATFNGTITPVGQLNYLSGTIPSINMTVSQATLVSPPGLIGLLPNRPVITSIINPGTTFGITPSATAVIGTSFSMRAGYKAKFTLTNGTGSQNVAYVTTNDIDSNSGATITAFGSNGDDINNSTISLFRTLNWGPLVAPSGSVYYTFVN